MPDDPPPRSEAPASGVGILPYVDWQTRHRIMYELRPRGASFRLPPPRWWARPEVVAPLILAGGIFIQPIGLRAIRAADAWAVVVTASWISGMIGVALLTARRRRPVVIELSERTLRLENVRPLLASGPESQTTIAVPREEVTDISYVNHAGTIIVRRRGRELLELKPSNRPGVVRWIVEELRRALAC